MVTVGVVDGALVYAVERDGRKLILPSRLGFEFRERRRCTRASRSRARTRRANDEVWEQPWGEMALVRDLHNELRVSVAETGEPGRRFDVVFRAFDDGIAFRYELPEQDGLGEFEIMDELTEFRLAEDPRAWWIPANDPTHRYELLYRSSPASTLPEVHTPLTLEMLDGPVLVIHEANLVDYAGMNLTELLRSTPVRDAPGVGRRGESEGPDAVRDSLEDDPDRGPGGRPDALHPGTQAQSRRASSRTSAGSSP